MVARPVGFVCGRVPRRGVCGQRKLEKFVKLAKSLAKDVPIAFSGFDEGGKFFELLTSDRSLGVEGLEIISEVAVNVFVVVTLGEFPELPAEALVAGIIFSGRTPAVATPISKALRVGFQGRLVANIHSTPLPHGKVVRGIERLRRDVAP